MSVPKYPLLRNVHATLTNPGEGENFLTKANYYYHHYGCDGFNDAGWGCGYRTLQTICSMLTTVSAVQPPSINEIQKILVKIEDKEEKFVGSRDWIGAAETCYVIDELFQIPCYLHHISANEKISSRKTEIVNYFQLQGGLIAMGGDQDAASKLIAGAHVSSDDELSLLVIDPHFIGIPKSATELIDREFVKWQKESEFMDCSFYNLCLPKIAS